MSWSPGIEGVAKLDGRRRRGRGARVRAKSAQGLGPTRPCQPGQDSRAAIARVLPLWPDELEDASQAGRQRILARLHRALRAERRRGVSGHWSYDLARHAELLRVYKQELAALRAQSELGAEPPDRATGCPRPGRC